MAPVEIIFILLGVVILLVSCFVGGKEDKEETVFTVPEEVMEAQRQEIKKYADQLMEEKSEEIIIKTDDYLSKISNEKIMAVNDFSNQILEKIDANHKEVVFLYDMLNQKEDDIKKTVQQFDQEKQQMQDAVGNVIKLTKHLKASMKKTDEAATQEDAEKSKKTEVKVQPAKQADTLQETVNPENGQMEFAEMMPADRQKEEVLKLYKEGKSILDISKSMSMGQGEVKLIIDLYGA